MAARMDHLSAALRDVDVQMVHDGDDLDDIEDKLPPPPLHARDVSQGSQESDSRFAPSTADTEEEDEGDRLHQQHLQRQHHMMMNAQHQPPPSMLAMAQSRQLKSASSSPQATKMLLRPNSSQSIIETGSISSSTTAAPYEQRRRLGTNSIASSSSASIGSVMVRGGVKPSTDERTGFARIYFENQNFTSSTVFKLFVNTTVLEVCGHAKQSVQLAGPVADWQP